MSTAKIQNLTIFGNVEIYEDSAIAKAKQKSFNKSLVGKQQYSYREYIN
jgi:hypothetical protein